MFLLKLNAIDLAQHFLSLPSPHLSPFLPRLPHLPCNLWVVFYWFKKWQQCTKAKWWKHLCFVSSLLQTDKHISISSKLIFSKKQSIKNKCLLMVMTIIRKLCHYSLASVTRKPILTVCVCFFFFLATASGGENPSVSNIHENSLNFREKINLNILKWDPLPAKMFWRHSADQGCFSSASSSNFPFDTLHCLFRR